MKIIVENEAEKAELIKISRYLHDFRVYKNGKSTKIYAGDGNKKDVNKFVTIKKGELFSLDLEMEAGNYLRHLYLTPELIQVDGGKK